MRMFTWQDNFQSHRADGRHVSSLAALMHQIRAERPLLEYAPGMTREAFQAWRERVRTTLHQLMSFPACTPQPSPIRLWQEERDGYRLEKWEFYPDDYFAVPILMLIPSSASAQNPTPGVLCFPGSASAKELLAGEPGFAHPNCSRQRKFPERNDQARHIALAGMVAVAFDNPGTAELAEFNPPDRETQGQTRCALVNGLINTGQDYIGLSVFQKLRFLEWFKTLPYVDANRIGCCGHSLGSEAEMVLGVLCDDIKVMVHNDFLCDPQHRYVAVTNTETMSDGGNWHFVPGFWKWFGFSDLLAAAAPKYLTINEGGADMFVDKVRDAYRLLGAEDRLQVAYYPRFQSPDTRKHQHEPVPRENLSQAEFYEDYSYVDVPDHSFRPEPSLRWLKKALA